MGSIVSSSRSRETQVSKEVGNSGDGMSEWAIQATTDLKETEE